MNLNLVDLLPAREIFDAFCRCDCLVRGPGIVGGGKGVDEG